MQGKPQAGLCFPYASHMAAIQFLKTSWMPVDFTLNSHYTVLGVSAYASVFFNFPVVFLKGTLLLRVPFTIF
jgi:hypothetical protein